METLDFSLGAACTYTDLFARHVKKKGGLEEGRKRHKMRRPEGTIEDDEHMALGKTSRNKV